MNKTLTLIRHAKADAPHGVSDQQRPLSEKGWQQVKRASSALHKRAVSFEQIYCSDALRTRQTAEQLNNHLGLMSACLHYQADLYLASHNTLLACVNATPNQYQHVALIGHNPGLSDLWRLLSAQYQTVLSSCAIVTMALCVDDWRAVDYSVATSSEVWRA